MAMSDSEQEYFPPKPEDVKGFKKPVSWLGGRELISSLKSMIIYSIYGENIDPRSWMKSDIYPPTGEDENNEHIAQEIWSKKIEGYWDWKKTRFKFWEAYDNYRNQSDNPLSSEFFFDFMADSGDGQMGVYGAGCLCFSDLWLDESKNITFAPPKCGKCKQSDCAECEQLFKKSTLLPRGAFLFLGGDTAYHVADYSTLHERFQIPFRWAFADNRKYLFEHYEWNEKKDEYFVHGDRMFDLNDKSEKGLIKAKELNIANTSADSERMPKWNGMLSLLNAENQVQYLDTEPVRPLFGIPGNHDYYDDIDGFNRQFRRPPFNELEENKFRIQEPNGMPLSIPTFQREQEASYAAIHLPFEWWMLGIDSENEKLDFRQRIFFQELCRRELKKIILATSEPTTVFGRKSAPEDKTAAYLKVLTGFMGLRQPFLNDGRLEKESHEKDESPPADPFKEGDYCRLDLSGDVHHYARYWGPTPDGKNSSDEFESKNYASVVSGGGGAFFDPTQTLFGTHKVKVNGKTQKAPGEIKPQKIFPPALESIKATADRIFDLNNIRKGGYVHLVGMVIAIIIYLSLNYIPALEEFISAAKNTTLKDDFEGLYAAFYLLATATLLLSSGFSLHNLVRQIKDSRSKKITQKSKIRKGRISEIKIPFFTFFVGIGIYFLMFLALQTFAKSTFAGASAYAQTLFLLLNLVIAGLIVWINIEYSNWLTQRFKIASESKVKPDNWLGVIYESPQIRRLLRKLENQDSVISRGWIWYRKKSIDTIPPAILIACAVIVLLTGINRFGNRPLAEITVETLFTVVVVGGLIGLVSFAVTTGAARHRWRGKTQFAFIGLWHAVLQLFTPFVVVFYGDWRFVLGVFAAIIITNGKFVHLGSQIMKRGNALLLSIVWFIYGATILAIPLIYPKNNLITPDSTKQIVGLVENYTGRTFEYLPIAGSILLVCIFGLRMSRMWFSWYLAVSLAFNGHNNEAGGAARIEDFKHILRIKVENEKLTVYVIGFEKAQPNMSELEKQLKLIDKFELRTKHLA